LNDGQGVGFVHRGGGSSQAPKSLTLRLVVIVMAGGGPIAVGTPITGRPPHRTVRAAFPHTAPTSGV
jgi:hypothetical protein